MKNNKGSDDYRTMLKQLHQNLVAIRRRQWRVAAVRGGALGLLAGGCLFFAIAVLWRLGFSVSAALASGALLLTTLGAAALPVLRPRGWHTAAKAVDRRYDLRDRTVTALAFAAADDTDEIQRLQIQDALVHLQSVNAREVVPVALPRPVPVACGMVLAGVVMFLLPLDAASNVEAPRGTSPELVEQSQAIESLIQDLQKRVEELQKEDTSGDLKQLQDLADQLPKLKNEAKMLRESNVNLRVAMAKLSKLEMALDKHRKSAEFDLASVDKHLKNVGDAMSLTDALRPASEALKNQKYEAAAKELEQADGMNVEGMDAKSLAKRLDEAAAKMKADGQKKLSQATRDMSKNLRAQGEQRGLGSSKLAAMTRNQGLRKSLSNLLSSKMNSLAESKQALRGKGGSNTENVNESKSPSDKYGKGSTGKLDGKKATQLSATRDLKKISGMAGEGPTQKQLVKSQDAKQQAKRGYRETFARFQKISEAILENEPLPMGHRQTIRRYFQSIRPQKE